MLSHLSGKAGRGIVAVLPPLEWLPRYEASWLRFDLVAGVTLAAYAIPVSLAYAMLAGLPPHYGIYCYLVGGLGYALFGTSRQLAVGPTSAIAMLVGTTVAGTTGAVVPAFAAGMFATLGGGGSLPCWISITRCCTFFGNCGAAVMVGGGVVAVGAPGAGAAGAGWLMTLRMTVVLWMLL